MAMYMYVVTSKEEMASDFIVFTCQFIPKSFSTSPCDIHDAIISEDPLITKFAFYSGSRVEFYIRPLNTCIGDTDYIVCRADRLAFSGDFPVLPRDISGLADTIRCFEIESNRECPGFVRLLDWGEMKYNWKHKVYKINRKINPDSYTLLDRIGALNKYTAKWLDESDKRTLPKFCGPA